MGFILAGSEELGIGGGGSTFQGLVVVFPVKDEEVKKEWSFLLKGPLDSSVIAIPPSLDFSFM